VTGLDIVALPGSSTTSLGVTMDVVSAANRLAERAVFDVRVLSTDVPRVRLREGASVESRSIASARARDVVVVLGLGAALPEEIAARVALPDVTDAAAWLYKGWRRGALVAASCTGVFVLGRAGLLVGRRCTSTWWLIPALRTLVPSCEATLDSMVTEHDRVWTAGAAFAHIDLMLALVARLSGAALAAEVARHLVVEQRASQARFVVPSFLAAQDPLASRVEALIRRRLAAAPSLDEMAAKVGVSSRTLARRLAAATGLSPMRFAQKIRVDAAIHMLQTTRKAIDAVAHEVGFEDASALYRLMLRHTGKPPSAFRGRAASL
jgi:transcriptional regulator GlxA family with amidase domain